MIGVQQKITIVQPEWLSRAPTAPTHRLALTQDAKTLQFAVSLLLVDAVAQFQDFDDSRFAEARRFVQEAWSRSEVAKDVFIRPEIWRSPEQLSQYPVPWRKIVR